MDAGKQALRRAPHAMQCWNRWAFGLPQRALLPGVLPWWSCQARFQSELRVGWEVSSLGRVKTSQGLIHYGTLSCYGYRRVIIASKAYYVHRLVARAFQGPPPSAAHAHVNHLDGNPRNNAVFNLEYATPSENIRHARATKESTRGKQPSKAVDCRPIGTGPWTTFASRTEAAHALGLCRSQIGRCCAGLRKKLCGYEFQNAETAQIKGEVWKAARYPGMTLPISSWMVSSHGRVKTDSGYTTCGALSRAGYFLIHCRVKPAGLDQTFIVHRLVAATFLGQPNAADLKVNHKDGNRANNLVSNLEYVTQSQNMQHAYSQRKLKDCKVQRPNRWKPVLGREFGGSCDWQHFESMKAASENTGINVSNISAVCRGSQSHTLNWEFKFAASNELPGEEWREVILDWSPASSNS